MINRMKIYFLTAYLSVSFNLDLGFFTKRTPGKLWDYPLHLRMYAFKLPLILPKEPRNIAMPILNN